ncbi:histidine kinase, partial [Streptomyces sp. NPDC059680]
MRAAPEGRALPVLMVTSGREPAGTVDARWQGADDCVAEGCEPAELAARIETALRRLPVPVERLPLDPRTGLYAHAHFLEELRRELRRPEGGGGRRGGVVAVVGVAEMEGLVSRLGPGARGEVL